MNILTDWSYRFRNLIDNDVKTLLNQRIHESANYNLFVTEVYQDILRFLARRSLGPVLTLAVYAGYRNFELDPDIVRVGTAIEFYSFSVLIHDDIIDCDAKRMGDYTFHKLYELKASEKDLCSTDPQRFGQSIALLAGNILTSLSFETLSSISLPEGKKSKIIRVLSKGARRLNESQLVDVLFENLYPSSNDWYVMASLRAAQHVSSCIAIGGIIAEIDQDEEKLLQDASENLGYMYDIRDDIIDTFRRVPYSSEEFRKDIRMKKKPLHLCYALEKANEVDKVRIIQLLRQPLNESAELVDLIKSSGLKEALERFENHGRKALELINFTKLSSQAKTFFNLLIEHEVQTMSKFKSL